MNRIYRLVYSRTLNAWVAVSEISRGHKKSSGASKSIAATAATMALTLLSSHASAAPTGGVVVSGAGRITQSPATGGAVNTTITQGSAVLNLNWSGFNVGSNENVTFNQSSSSDVAVNRIYATSGAQIMGHLTANGQVYLIDPNGIVFGKNAQVNVGGLVASTMNMNPGAGQTLSFSGTSKAGIDNQGSLTAAQGGFIALLGHVVSNEGTVSARLGTVAMAGGSAFTLTFGGNQLVSLVVTQSQLNDLAKNGGLVSANGGQVVLTAGAKDALMASAVNNDGIIEAQTVAGHEGRISLLGGMTAGTVADNGTLDASAPNGGNGGNIDTSAHGVQIGGNAIITTKALSGSNGNWLIDPVDFTIAASGGDVSGATLSNSLGSGNVTILSSQGASAGTGSINVNDGVSWSANTLTLTAADNININAAMNATGTAGLNLNPATSNGTETAVSGGNVLVGMTGTGFAGQVNLASTANISINGTPYTIINSVGAQGSMTGTDLQGINGNLSGHYVLGSNIDASATSTWNSGAGFTPIGQATPNFGGVLNGLGHTIDNITINLPSTSEVGVIGKSLGTVVNTGLSGGTITGGNQTAGLVANMSAGIVANDYSTGTTINGVNGVGGIVGYMPGGVVSNSFTINGTINGSHEYTGGVVGNIAALGSTVTDVWSSDAVNGNQMTGGVVGGNSGTLSYSYATGAVYSNYRDAGGLLGINSSGATVTNSYATGNVISGSGGGTCGGGGLIAWNSGSITNSYATGSVTGTSGVWTGGLVGINGSSGTVSTSYSTGAVHYGGGASAGGLIGANDNTATNGGVTNAFWDTSTSGYTTSYGGVGLTTTQMRSAANFTGFNFTSTPGATGNNWVMVDASGTLNNSGGSTDLGATFPMLASEYSTSINNAHQLQLMVMNTNANYTLGSNINAGNTVTTSGFNDVWDTTNGFVPVGNASNPLNGTFDGEGHTISNLFIDEPSTGSIGVGLFGVTNPGSVISNVGLVGGSVTSGGTSVGELVGSNSGTISNSYTTGSVSGNTDVGGLAGYNGGTVNKDYATGSVSGNSYVGGLVGSNAGGTVGISYASGNVTGTGDYVGGLVGYNNSGTISNAYATGGVSDANTTGYDIGGLVGSNAGGTVSDTYAVGSVNSASSDVGGLAGYNNGGTISNSFYDINTTGQTNGIGATTDVAGTVWGMTTAQMQTQANFTSATTANGNVNPAWDFTTPVWGIKSGYPILCAFSSCATTVYVDPLSGSSTYGSAPAITYDFVNSGGTQVSLTNATATGTATYSASAPTNTSNVGNYSFTYSSGLSLTGSGANNYILAPWATSTSWIVNPATLTVTANQVSRTYGSANPALSGSVTGFVLGQTEAAVTTGTETFSTTATSASNVGSYGVTGSGLSTNGNYVLAQAAGNSTALTVDPATLTVTGLSSTNRVYNGGTVDALSGTAVLNGLINGQTLTTGNTSTGTLASANAGVESVTTSVTIGNGTGLASNYVLTQPTGLTATISQAGLSAAIIGDPSKVYDGTTGATLASTNYQLTGFVTGQGATVNQPTGTYNSKEVGTANLVTASLSPADFSANSGTLLSNYVLPTSATGAGNITPKAIIVTASGTNRVYNGTVNDGVTLGSNGVVNGDTVGFTDASATFANKNVGNAKVVSVTGISDFGTNAGDYTVNNSTLTTANITPATLTYNASRVVWHQGSNKNGQLAGVVSGFVGGDNISNATSGALTWTTAATSLSNVGKYAVSGGGLQATNYLFTQNQFNATALTVVPQPRVLGWLAQEDEVFDFVANYLGVNFSQNSEGATNLILSSWQPNVVEKNEGCAVSKCHDDFRLSMW